MPTAGCASGRLRQRQRQRVEDADYTIVTRRDADEVVVILESLFSLTVDRL